MSLCDSYSGVVLNQNATATDQYRWRDTYNGNWIYQTFTLPASHERGYSASEKIIPDLSGFQVLVSIDPSFAPSASLDYTLQYYGGVNVGWRPLTNGTVIGAHADGAFVWFDIIFPTSVPISPDLLGSEFRFGIQTRTAAATTFNQPVTVTSTNNYAIGTQTYAATLTNNVPYPITVGGLPAFLLLSDTKVTYSLQQGIATAWYTSPTPLMYRSTGYGQAYQADGITPLLGLGTSASLNFRLLGLTADNGTNFLGNEYRSAVIQTSAGNTDTTNGINPIQGSGSASYYMSPPQPSPFSVISLYFDMRPVPSTPTYGAINIIGNPSFEYDAVNQAPSWWQTYTGTTSGTVLAQAVSQSWSYEGRQSLHMNYTFTANGQENGITTAILPISPTTGGQATPYSLSAQWNVVAISNAELQVGVVWYDSNEVILTWANDLITTTTGTGNVEFSSTVPANAAYVQFIIYAQSTAASASFEGYMDAIQVTYSPSVQPYFDGDTLGYTWTAQRGQSPSVQLIDPEVQDDTVVLDGVLIDPVTPNMAVNVYYSSDDAYTSSNMTESDWEQKLWTRVPEVYLCTQRTQYVFPQPIQAKYTKIEFTNLPAQSYDPGPFQKAITYKKFPTWVANYFLNQMELPSFVTSLVNVQYDALQFAYNYYLDDLDRSPLVPSAPPSDLGSQLTTYFNSNPSGVDANTLSKIQLAMKPFQQTQPTMDAFSALGGYAANLIRNSVIPLTSEGGVPTPIDYSTVSSLQREPVVLEQSMPVMYFFLTCRHAYKELTASFEYNRAYFAGVNDIAFMRHDYTVAADTPQYIETGGDLANIQSTDWVVDTDGNWHTY